jgi:TolB-like protein
MDALILHEVESLLAWKPMQSSPLLCRFLKFVVNETLAGRENQIKEYTVAREVLGRPVEFSNGQDASVRIHAMRLRKLLGDYYQGPGADAKVLIELPKGSYRPVFRFKEDEIILQGRQNTSSSPADVIPEEKVLIMPFICLSRNTDFDFEIDGFCEYLTEKLMMFQDIAVIPYEFVLKSIQSGTLPGEVVKALDATCYVSGNIEFTENQIDVSVRLVDAADDMLIWNYEEKYDLKTMGLMDVVEMMTLRIASSIAGYSGHIHKKRINGGLNNLRLAGKLENAVVWFYSYQSRNSRELFYTALRSLEENLKEGEDCALCHAVLATLYADSLLYMYDVGVDATAKAEYHTKMALALDPVCQHAYIVSGWVNIINGKRSEAFVDLEHALSLNPNSSFCISAHSFGMSLLGHYEKSLASFDKVRRLDSTPYWWLNLSKVFYAFSQHKFEEGLFYAMHQGTPKVIYEDVLEMIALLNLGRYDEMLQRRERHIVKYPGGLQYLGVVFPRIIFDPTLKKLIEESLIRIVSFEPELKLRNT